LTSQIQEVDWPHPACDDSDEPHFLFILTPPYSGSTALAQFLNQSPRAMLLDPRGEGQWLVPGLHRSDRWHADKPVDYRSVRSVWLRAYQDRKAGDSQIALVIEKSPPNMVRIDRLLDTFRDHSLLANNRDPYANCSSILHRIHADAARDPGARAVLLRELARDWLDRSARLQELIAAHGVPLLTYEAFCADPLAVTKVLPGLGPKLARLDADAAVTVKDYPVQGITNQNDRQIGQLSVPDLQEISAVLAPCEPVVSFFGYRILDPVSP
jgi:hypothetical protein